MSQLGSITAEKEKQMALERQVSGSKSKNAGTAEI